MNSHQMQGGMSEALRLTQEGRLAEATAVVQRTLGGAYSPAAKPDSPENSEEPVDVTSYVVDKDPETAPPSQSSSSGPALRPAPKSSRGFRDARRSPGGLFGDLPGMETVVPEPADASPAGQFVERSYTDQAGTRAYKLYVPSGYVGQAAPMVVMLHGCTQTPDDFAAGTRMNALAEEQTFLVAYPAQSSNANFSKCWNWFEPANQRRGNGEPSIIAGITRQISDEYRVADGRVCVAGMSSGGAMAAIMGETYPDLFAAVGVHSGLAPGSAQDLSSAFTAMRSGGTGSARRASKTPRKLAPAAPMIVFHGDRDTTVHPRNADHLLAYWNAANEPTPRLAERPGQMPGGYSYTHAVRRDKDGRPIAEQWTVHGLGHAWSGGSVSGSYTDSRGPDASAEMIRFFNQRS